MIVSNRPDLTISPGEEPPGGLERAAAVAHAGLLLVGELGERAAERRGEKHPGAAEATPPPRRRRAHAFHHALDHPLAPAPGPPGGCPAARRRGVPAARVPWRD